MNDCHSLNSRFAANTRVSLIRIFAFMLLVGFCGCSGIPHGAQLQPEEPVVWAERTTGSSASVSHEDGVFELTQLTDPDSPQPVTEPESEEGWDSVDEYLAALPSGRSYWQILMDDQREFYSRQNVGPALLTLGGAAILANTQADQEFSDWYQTDVRTESLDDIADVTKLFGEQWPMVGLYVGASATGRWLEVDPRWAKWGDNSLRSMFVGVPPLLFLQKALGSSRPNDVPASSEWNFWNDDNGASGHTFVGAVPFLVAAQLAERRSAKATWLFLSTCTGWSRINDDDHYLSQVIVGWWLAYAATRSVERSDELGWEIAPTFIDGSAGLEARWRR